VLSGQLNCVGTKSHFITGKWPALWGSDFGFGAQGNDDIRARSEMIAEAKRQSGEGSLIALTWTAVRPVDDEAAGRKESVEARLTDEQWQELLTPGANIVLIQRASQARTTAQNELRPEYDFDHAKDKPIHRRFALREGLSRLSSAQVSQRSVTHLRLATSCSVPQLQPSHDGPEQIAPPEDEAVTKGEKLTSTRWYKGHAFAAKSPALVGPICRMERAYERRNTPGQ
jgi:hypothetical protein